MATASIAGSIRPFHLLLIDRASRPMWLARISELLGDWVLLVALFALVYRISGSIAAVALFMLARALPRAVVIMWCSALTARMTVTQLAVLNALRVPLVASLLLVAARRDLWWAGVVALAIGVIAALLDAARAAVLPCVVPRTQLAAANALNVSVERVCFVAGPLLGALLLYQWHSDAAFILVVVTQAVAALLLWLQTRVEPVSMAVQAPSASVEIGSASWVALRERPVILILVGALFTGAVVAISLKITLIAVAVEALERSDAVLGLLIAAVGLGTLVGPVSIPRLMGRLPVPLFITGSVVALACGMAVISRVESLLVVTAILFLIGLFSITNDIIASTAARRFTRDEQLLSVARVMFGAVIAGQVVAALAVSVLAGLWDFASVMLIMGIASAAGISVLFLMTYGRAKLARR
jgi:hypothetical protein